MRVGTSVGFGQRLAGISELARQQEELGYDDVWVIESCHDPFTMLGAITGATREVTLGTNIAVAFARNPMTLAYAANDVQLLSEGRFVLGLGSQIQAHITKRFSMPWSKPAARMREMVTAVRAIWESWNTETKVDFRGDFYQHTLMNPFFDPGPNPFGPPLIALAGVGPMMTEVAGETSDVFLCHSFTTEQFLRETTIPALERGAARAGRSPDDIRLVGQPFVATGADEDELVQATRSTRERIAFYGSTPAYRPVLECHGWGDLQTELNALSKQGRWVEMGDLIDDEILHTLAVVGEPEQLPALLIERYGQLAQRVNVDVATPDDPARWSGVLGQLHEA